MVVQVYRKQLHTALGERPNEQRNVVCSALKDKAGNVSYFSYYQEIPWEDQSQQNISPSLHVF